MAFQASGDATALRHSSVSITASYPLLGLCRSRRNPVMVRKLYFETAMRRKKRVKVANDKLRIRNLRSVFDVFLPK
jgi:hypothetical protein